MSSSMVGKTWNIVPTIGFLAYQILGIVGSQIETKTILFLAYVYLQT
jgi:hypothetical protein